MRKKAKITIHGVQFVLNEITRRTSESSLRQVAKDIGISPAYLSDVMNHRRNVSDWLADAFGFTLEIEEIRTYRKKR